MLKLFTPLDLRYAVTVYPEKQYGGGAGWFFHEMYNPDAVLTPAELQEIAGEAVMLALRDKADLRAWN
jgi:hypothetical protein